jgi:hypothetical protein
LQIRSSQQSPDTAQPVPSALHIGPASKSSNGSPSDRAPQAEISVKIMARASMTQATRRASQERIRRWYS